MNRYHYPRTGAGKRKPVAVTNPDTEWVSEANPNPSVGEIPMSGGRPGKRRPSGKSRTSDQVRAKNLIRFRSGAK